MVEDNRAYSSGLTEEELAEVWAALKEKHPLLYEKFLHPDYTSEDSDQELRSQHGGLHHFIQSSFPDVRPFPEAHAIYRDMIIYFDRNLWNKSL